MTNGKPKLVVEEVKEECIEPFPDAACFWDKVSYYKCPECKRVLSKGYPMTDFKFCHYCGQAVKWY